MQYPSPSLIRIFSAARLFAGLVATGLLVACAASPTPVPATPVLPTPVPTAVTAAPTSTPVATPTHAIASALPTTPLTTVDTAALQAILASIPGDDASSMIVRVQEGTGVWTGAAGVRDLASQSPVDAAGYFRIGSVSKTFTAALVLRMVDAGQIALDAPLHSYLPGRLPPSDDAITIRHLLQHTSGLADYELLVGMGNPATIVERRAQVYTLDELIALAIDQPRLFAPGTDQAYAGTNYLLLQAVIEEVTGEPYGVALHRLILEPAGLTQTFAPGADPALPEPHARGYVAMQGGGQPTLVDISEWNPSVAAAAGELISTLADLTTFHTKLLAGELVPPTLLAEMMQRFPEGELGPGAYYGLGITLLELPCGVMVSGHGGTVPGYRTGLYATPEGRHLAYSMTTTGRGGQAGRAINTLMTTTFCGGQ